MHIATYVFDFLHNVAFTVLIDGEFKRGGGGPAKKEEKGKESIIINATI